MSKLPTSFLGKKVYLDGANQQCYVLKYEERQDNRKVHALLFDQETPVIFAVLDQQGRFLDSYYLSNKTTRESTEALERYKIISERKKQHNVTQDDLKDALRPEEEAKMKNKNILKHLVDEHLEDIKNQWPSRLISLQNSEGKSDNSLIMVTLDKALDQANASKSFHFLLNHRIDSYIPKLAKFVNEHPQLVDEIAQYYLSYDQAKLMEQFLYQAATYVKVDNHQTVERILHQAQNIDHVHYSSVLRNILIKLFKRVKKETETPTKEWLTKSVQEPPLRKTIIELLKTKTG